MHSRKKIYISPVCLSERCSFGDTKTRLVRGLQAASLVLGLSWCRPSSPWFPRRRNASPTRCSRSTTLRPRRNASRPPRRSGPPPEGARPRNRSEPATRPALRQNDREQPSCKGQQRSQLCRPPRMTFGRSQRLEITRKNQWNKTRIQQTRVVPKPRRILEGKSAKGGQQTPAVMEVRRKKSHMISQQRRSPREGDAH